MKHVLLCVLILSISGMQAQMFFPAMLTKKEMVLRKRADSLQTLVNSEGKTNWKEVREALNSATTVSLANQKHTDVLRAFRALNETETASGFAGLGYDPFGDKMNLSFGGMTRLMKSKPGKLIDPLDVYLEYRTALGKTSDSLFIQKTFIFPEIGKNTIATGFHLYWGPATWNYGIQGEVSLNRYQADSNQFVSQSAFLGFRIEKLPTAPNTGWLAVVAYLNVINVDSKYRPSYPALMNEENLPLTIWAAGLNVAIGPQNAALFCNAKYLFLDHTRIRDPELKSFVYTVGIKAILSRNIVNIF